MPEHSTHQTKPCPIPSSITGQPCLLPEGHPPDSPTRFHRYAAPPEVEMDKFTVVVSGFLEKDIAHSFADWVGVGIKGTGLEVEVIPEVSVDIELTGNRLEEIYQNIISTRGAQRDRALEELRIYIQGNPHSTRRSPQERKYGRSRANEGTSRQSSQGDRAGGAGEEG